MSTPEHLAGYEAISTAFHSATGRQLTSYIVCGVDSQGEVYSGAMAPRGVDHTSLIRVTSQRLEFVREQANRKPA